MKTMKKVMAVVLMMVAVLACVSALTETHTIVLISKVELEMPEFAIRSLENGLVGKSVVYSTSAITDGDVRTGFELIQTNDSNYYGKMDFTVSATELMAKVGNRVYSTQGVQIIMDGVQYGQSAEFSAFFQGARLASGETVKAFEVVWTGDAALAQATYEAVVTLTYTAA